jgi:hypothetical protein
MARQLVKHHRFVQVETPVDVPLPKSKQPNAFPCAIKSFT